MFDVAKNSKDVDGHPAPSGKEISPAVEPNTSEWRARVKAELKKRGRGAQADLTRHLQAKYPSFSSGTMADTLRDDEYAGQPRWSAYISDINAYLWPQENPHIDPTLRLVLRSMNAEEQRALADLARLLKSDKKK